MTNTNQNENTNNDFEPNLFAEEDKYSALQKQVEDLKRQVAMALARGTGDVTEKAEMATKALKTEEPKPVALSTRIEQALRAKPQTLAELAKTLGEPVGKVQTAMKSIRAQKKVYNISQEDNPRWVWRVGPNATSKELQSVVLGLIQDQPLSFAQICAATGAKGAIIQGALIEIRRSGKVVHNLGTKARARYFILPENVIDARLTPKEPSGHAGSRKQKKSL